MCVHMIKNRVVVLVSLLGLSLSGCFVSGGGVHVGVPVAHHHGGPPAHAPAHGHRASTIITIILPLRFTLTLGDKSISIFPVTYGI